MTPKKAYDNIKYCMDRIPVEYGIVWEVATMRIAITLACTECKNRNYNTTKNKKNVPDRIELKKYCKFCKTHTAHKETK